MAKRAQRVVLFATLGFVLSAVAAISVAAGLAVILPKLNLQDKIMDLGTMRKPIAMLTIFLSVALGIGGFLLGLEGTSSEENKFRTIGWIGFWLGTISAMVGIVLGLMYWGYQY
jgi:hypothetical protein